MQLYVTFWGSNEVVLQFSFFTPHSDRHPIYQTFASFVSFQNEAALTHMHALHT